MEFSQVVGARKMNRGPELYQMGDQWELCANPPCVFSLLCRAYTCNREENTYM